MPKKEMKNTLITVALIVILGVVLGATAQNVLSYYTGPNYIVNTYLKYLKERNYNKLYGILDPESLKEVGEKNEIIEYYKRTYEQKNKLINVKASVAVGQTYTLKYFFNKGTEQATLSVIQKGGKWYVEFPFKAYDVEIFAPYGAKVYLDSTEISYSNQKSYQMKNVLPGTYLLKVDPIQEAYAPYYKMLEIPTEKNYIVPYDLAHVTINVAPQLKVKLGYFSQLSEQSKVEFEDLLLGKYQIAVQDSEGYLEKQEVEIDVKEGENIFTLRDFKLSNKGKKKLEDFFRGFYKSYLEGIKTHDSERIASYFAPTNKVQQLSLYNSWYIDKKNVSEATISIKLGESIMDEQGILHTEIIENIELYHETYDEVKEEHVTEVYKVMIKWDTSMSILEKEWQIIDREIKESVVAVKDQEGHWVQY